MKLVNLVNEKGRDAQIEYFNPANVQKVFFVTEAGDPVTVQRLIKSVTTAEDLFSNRENSAAVSQALIDSDPDVDMEVIGRCSGQSTRVFIDSENKFLFKVAQKEFVYNQAGKLIEERTPKHTESNVSEDSPIRGTRLIAKHEVFKKFVLARKYQLKHVNSLTFDFLFDIAKELHEKQSMMLLGGGAKGTDPLVFENGGKPYRAFLEGRVEGERYLLLLHLSNMELKAVNPE